MSPDAFQGLSNLEDLDMRECGLVLAPGICSFFIYTIESMIYLLIDQSVIKKAYVHLLVKVMNIYAYFFFTHIDKKKHLFQAYTRLAPL